MTTFRRKILLIAAILLVSFSLRSPLTAIGPLAGLIREDLGVSNGFVGLITTLPLITFALCSPLVPRLSGRWGLRKTVMVGLFFIALGGVLRAYGGVLGLIVGTGMVGAGICVGNVLLPSIVKANFPLKIGMMTSMYATGMSLFAAIGAGVSYPLVSHGLAWQKVLLIWSGIAFAALCFWFFQKKDQPDGRKPLPEQHGSASQEGLAEPQGSDRQDAHGRETTYQATAVEKGRSKGKSIWKSPLAWCITVFMGLQSLHFYSLTAWVPSMVQSWGQSPESAGYVALWFQLIGIPSTFLTPIIAAKLKSQMPVAIMSGSCSILGIILLLFQPPLPVVLLAILLIANSLCAIFSWSLAMAGLRAETAEESAALSGMMQSMGYALAAVGPTLCGVLFDRTGAWSSVLFVLLAVAVVMLIAGILAAKREKLFS